MEVKRGYKQTEVGVIPEDWDTKPLGALVGYINGKAHEQSINDSGRFVVVNSKFISTEGFTRKYSESSFCPASKGDVLMVMSDVPNGRAIAKCYWVESDNTYTVNQRICILNPRGVDGKLLFYKLDRNPFYLAFDDGAKQTNLRKDEVLACPLGIPKSETEQRAIAAALSDVDGLLGGLDRLIAKKRDLKQAAMQLLLTGQTRLPGLHGEWEVKRLKQVAEISTGINKPLSEMGSGALYVTVQDLYDKTSIRTERLSRIKVSPSEIETRGLTGGDIVFGKSSVKRDGIGYPSQFLGCDEPVVFSGFTYRARARQGTTDATFLFYALREEKTRRWLIDNSQASALTNINQTIADAIPIQVPPSVPEQTAIATVLSEMDGELAVLEQRREKTRALKQAMMQELLTGRTRLAPSEEL